MFHVKHLDCDAGTPPPRLTIFRRAPLRPLMVQALSVEARQLLYVPIPRQDGERVSDLSRPPHWGNPLLCALLKSQLLGVVNG
jgi:hypothetical protein